MRSVSRARSSVASTPSFVTARTASRMTGLPGKGSASDSAAAALSVQAFVIRRKPTVVRKFW